MKFSKYAAVFATLATALLAMASQDEVLLRRELKEGAADLYAMSMKSSQLLTMDAGMGMPDMPIDMAMQLNMKIGYKSIDKEKNVADLDVLMTDIKFDFGEMGAMMGGAADQLPKEMQVTGKLDARNRITNVKFPSAGQASMMLGGGSGQTLGPMFVEFPEKAVKFGDAWDVLLEGNSLTKNEPVKMKATLVGLKDLNGKSAYEISVKGTMALDGDVSDMLKDNPQAPQMKVLMKGTIDMDGTALVEKITGRTLKMDLNMKSKQNIEIPDYGMMMHANGTTAIKIELVPPKP